MAAAAKQAKNMVEWPRKVECTLCTPHHMVDARGIKMHQMKVMAEREALSDPIPVVEKNAQVDIHDYREGFKQGWVAAWEEARREMRKEQAA